MKLSKIFGEKVDFYRLLEEQSEFIVKSVSALESYVGTLDPSYAAEVKSLEREADRKRNELVQELNKTFITPFDREDIYMLSKALDDILDYYKTTVNEMEIYQIGLSTELAKFTQMLQQGSEAIREAVRTMKPDVSLSAQNAVKAKKFENKVEEIYRKSVAQLLESDDIKYIIKMREIYRHLSNCADRIDEAADIICQILMKTS
jgi:uncharacterized protein